MNIYQSDSENKSEGADVGDQVATPIFDGAAPTEQLSEDLQNSTEEGSSENATEASTEVGTDSNTTEATTQAPAAQ